MSSDRFHLNRARNQYFGTNKRFNVCPATQCYSFQFKTDTVVSNIVQNRVYSCFTQANRQRLTTKPQVPLKMVYFGYSVVSCLTLCSLKWGGDIIRSRENLGPSASKQHHSSACVDGSQCFRRKNLIAFFNFIWNSLSETI